MGTFLWSRPQLSIKSNIQCFSDIRNHDLFIHTTHTSSIPFNELANTSANAKLVIASSKAYSAGGDRGGACHHGRRSWHKYTRCQRQRRWRQWAWAVFITSPVMGWNAFSITRSEREHGFIVKGQIIPLSRRHMRLALHLGEAVKPMNTPPNNL